MSGTMRLLELGLSTFGDVTAGADGALLLQAEMRSLRLYATEVAPRVRGSVELASEDV